MTMSANHITRLDAKDKAWQRGGLVGGGLQKCSSCSYVRECAAERVTRCDMRSLGDGMACGVSVTCDGLRFADP